ncbi:hypothetical protein ACFFRR_011294 [Megaselia abdita]
MNTLQGKNVVILGGLQGIGLKLTKNLLNKRVKNLFIIDFNENKDNVQELKTTFPATNIFFKRVFEANFNFDIQMTVQEITLKMHHIDVFINATELMVENDLKRAMDINMKIYLNTMMLALDVMDRTKGGRGGVIVNVLSNLCLENMELKICNYNDQQYLINKQMLMSLTEAFSQEEFFQQTGVAVMTVMPVISKGLVERNSEWIKNIGLEKLVKDIDNVNNFDAFKSVNFDLEEDEEDDFCEKNIFDYEIHNFHQDNTKASEIYSDEDYYYQDYDLELEERMRDSNSNVRRVFNKLCYNMVRGIEKGHNGSKTVVGLEGIKDFDKQDVLSRL